MCVKPFITQKQPARDSQSSRQPWALRDIRDSSPSNYLFHGNCNMDKPYSENPTGDDTNGDDPVVPTLHPDGIDGHHTEESIRYEEVGVRAIKNKKRSWWNKCGLRMRRGWGKTSWDRRIELFFAGMIVVFAFLQYMSSLSTSKQVDRIIGAAESIRDSSDQIKSAGYMFSGAAIGINNAGWNAFGQLKLQEQQMEAARKSTDTDAQKSLEATKEQMRLDQRAWLGAGDYAYTVAESSPIESVANVTNTGKTPALHVLCQSSGATILKGHILRETDIVYPAGLPTIKQGAIFPNQRFPLKTDAQPLNSVKQKSWFDNVQSGNWVQYFWGYVQYEDTFGKSHWTHFCTQYVPSTKSGTPCPVYNDTDDSQKEKR
jgi:hypothetical protein